MSFAIWLAELNEEAARRGYCGAETFWQGTGAECWRDMFDDRMTPTEAMDADEAMGV